MQEEASKRGCQIVTISFNGPAQDPARRGEMVASARAAMNFLKEFGAKHLVVFSPNRNSRRGPGAFQAMCEGFNELGARPARWASAPACTTTSGRWCRRRTSWTAA